MAILRRHRKNRKVIDCAVFFFWERRPLLLLARKGKINCTTETFETKDHHFQSRNSLPENECRTSDFSKDRVLISSSAVNEHSVSSTSNATASVAHPVSYKKVKP